MSEQSVQEELLQQVREQKESLEEISEMLAVDPSEQLQQVLQLCSPYSYAVRPDAALSPCVYRMTLSAAV